MRTEGKSLVEHAPASISETVVRPMSRHRCATTSGCARSYLWTVIVFAAILTGCKSPIDPSQSQCPASPFVSLPATDVWACPPAAAIHEIDADIRVVFLADPTAGTFVCHAQDGSVDLTSLQERAYQALYLLKRLQFDAPLPWTNEPLWTWFIESAQVIEYDPPGLGAIGNVPHFGGGTIYIPAYVPQIIVGRDYVTDQGFPTNVFGFVHEARHAQKQHDCNGTGDVSIPELGAFGVQYYFGLWLAGHVVAPSLTTGERNYALQASESLRASPTAFCTACGGL